MVRSCKQSLKRVLEVLHTSVMWSHIFYMATGILALYTGHPSIAILSFVVTVVSMIHHADAANKFFGKADMVTATSSLIFILFYSIFIVWKKKMPIIGVKNRVAMIVMFIMITVFATLFFYLAHLTVKNIQDDPIKGFIGPILTEEKEDPDAQECLDMSKQINYVFYHTLWHMFGGIAGMLIVIFIA